MRVPVDAVVVNTKNVKFPVRGFMWDDGTFFVHNPRPLKYPQYIGLMGKPGTRALEWVADKETLEPVETSLFCIESLVLAKRKTQGKKSR